MALQTSRTGLNQGVLTAVSDMVFATGVGADIGIDSAGAELPALAVGEFFEVRNHSLASNNGLYQIVTVNTTLEAYEADKVSGVAPVVAGSEAADTLGATGASTEKSVMLDTAGLGVYIMEQGNVDLLGVTGGAIYSFFMQEWKADNFIIANAPFPMNAIDTDAGKYIIGQDNLGNNNGWNWVDVGSFSIRTRKLVRDMGWDESDAAGIILNRYFSAVTLGTFEDPANDTAFFQFGTDTTVDDTVDFDFAGPVSEAVRFFERQVDGAINGGTGIAISADGRTLTRSDGGDWAVDGYKVGGQITLRDSEDAQSDGTWLLSVVGAGVDGVVTGGRAADAAEPVAFVDGGGGDDSLVLPAGTTWEQYGFVVGSNIIITVAEDGGNDGTHIITSFSADFLTAFVVTASFTANTDDETAVIGMFDDALTPDITVNGAINNDNAVRLGIRVRDGDPNGKTFGEANLASAGKTVLGNFVFAFPLANATDLKIIETDANIDANTPYTGMSITFHSTPQARAGLVGGSFNFGIIIEGNDGTGIEVFEFVQRQLRKLTDIDADADTAIGRAIGLLARFNGDTLEVGSGNGGLTVPVNPDGGGSGVFIDNLNAVDANDVTFLDNTGTFRTNPETIAVTLDFNQIAIDDATTEFDLFYDRTIRTNLTDFVLTAGSPATLTSAGSALPNNSELGAGSYVRVSGLTGGDAAMNGVFFILAETTPGDAWDVERYDGITVVTVSAATVDIDQNVIDTPDAILVDTNETLTDTTISFTAPDTIGDTGNGLAIFGIGERIRIAGSTGNNAIFEVLTSSASTLTVVEQSILTEAAGPSITITTVASGDATADFTFSYDFDGNVQGGRTVSTPTFVQAKAIGSTGAQYVQSAVSSIVSGVPLTIPLFAATERNFT